MKVVAENTESITSSTASTSISTSSNGGKSTMSSVSNSVSSTPSRTSLTLTTITSSSSGHQDTAQNLSSEAKAGIALGVVSLVVTFAVALLCLSKFKKDKRQRQAELSALPLHAAAPRQGSSFVTLVSALLPWKERKPRRPMSKLRAQLLEQKQHEMNNFEEIKIDSHDFQRPSTYRSELP